MCGTFENRTLTVSSSPARRFRGYLPRLCHVDREGLHTLAYYSQKATPSLTGDSNSTLRGVGPPLYLMTRAGIEPALSQEKIAAVTQYMSATKITIGSSRVV